jgi:hypothetical protein
MCPYTCGGVSLYMWRCVLIHVAVCVSICVVMRVSYLSSHTCPLYVFSYLSFICVLIRVRFICPLYVSGICGPYILYICVLICFMRTAVVRV